MKEQLQRAEKRAFLVGGVFLALLAAGAVGNRDQFFRSYLVAYIFWAGIALGCFAIVMLHHLVGGRWGFAIRRFLESGTRTVPLLVVLVLPLLFGLRSLYEWARPEAVAANEALQHKSLYLNVPFFLARLAIYFATWLLLARFLNRWSEEQDRTSEPALVRKLQSLSGPGLVLYGLTVTFASIDWVMSLEPHWFSTIYGAMFMVGQALSTMAFMIAVTMLMARRPAFAKTLTTVQFHDLGNLLLAFVMLWAYLSFSQFLLIWSGNLPEEIPWYLRRSEGGWLAVAVVLIVLHFAAPFVLLLSREVKRNLRRLSLVAVGILLMRLADTLWLVKPAFPQAGFHWMDIAAPVGVGGVWVGFFVRQLKARPLTPLQDPRLEGASHG